MPTPKRTLSSLPTSGSAPGSSTAAKLRKSANGRLGTAKLSRGLSGTAIFSPATGGVLGEARLRIGYGADRSSVGDKRAQAAHVLGATRAGEVVVETDLLTVRARRQRDDADVRAAKLQEGAQADQRLAHLDRRPTQSQRTGSVSSAISAGGSKRIWPGASLRSRAKRSVATP